MKLDDLKHLPIKEDFPYRAVEIAEVILENWKCVVYVSGIKKDGARLQLCGNSTVKKDKSFVSDSYLGFSLDEIKEYNILKKL